MSVADLLADTPDLAHIDDPFLGFSQESLPFLHINIVVLMGFEPALDSV